jgi:hypothetical protein
MKEKGADRTGQGTNEQRVTTGRGAEGSRMRNGSDPRGGAGLLSPSDSCPPDIWVDIFSQIT